MTGMIVFPVASNSRGRLEPRPSRLANIAIRFPVTTTSPTLQHFVSFMVTGRIADHKEPPGPTAAESA